MYMLLSNNHYTLKVVLLTKTSKMSDVSASNTHITSSKGIEMFGKVVCGECTVSHLFIKVSANTCILPNYKFSLIDVTVSFLWDVKKFLIP